MSKYKITVEEVVEPKQGDSYTSTVTIYEQIVTGDESIVNGVVKVVLDYNTHQVMQSKRGEE